MAPLAVASKGSLQMMIVGRRALVGMLWLLGVHRLAGEDDVVWCG